MTNWKKLFREFYDDNECGGSSRWLVAPNIVEMFIDFQLRESRREVIEMFEILKLEVDVVICDCGSPYGDSDLANYIDEFLLSLKKQDTEIKRLKGLGGDNRCKD